MRTSKLRSMLKIDFRRMFTSNLIYIMLLICFLIPVLMLVMTQMMPDTSVDQVTGEIVQVEKFESVWQAIGSLKNAEMTSMGITTMCNINLLYFIIGVFLCIFISEDFRSGYAKNIFTVRNNKFDYVLSKIISCFIAGALMFIVFFIGSMLGGKIASLSFSLDGFKAYNVLFCMLAKIFIVLIFVSLFTIFAVIAKSKLWLSIILSLSCGMIFFMMIGIIAPLDAGILNLVMALFGSIIFAVGMAIISKVILNKTRLV